MCSSDLGDNANIIPEEIPELLSYMDEVMPDKSGDDTEIGTSDILIDTDPYLSKQKRSGEEEPDESYMDKK